MDRQAKVKERKEKWENKELRAGKGGQRRGGGGA